MGCAHMQHYFQHVYGVFLDCIMDYRWAYLLKPYVLYVAKIFGVWYKYGPSVSCPMVPGDAITSSQRTQQVVN
jgi:hypothetical protein